jgi:hypothetical protein
MIGNRIVLAATALGLCVALGACVQFSDAVADHWPHWAGGMPNGVPPRPGAPGYDQFIAHGEPATAAASGAPGAPAVTAAPADPVAAGQKPVPVPVVEAPALAANRPGPQAVAPAAGVAGNPGGAPAGLY